MSGVILKTHLRAWDEPQVQHETLAGCRTRNRDMQSTEVAKLSGVWCVRSGKA